MLLQEILKHSQVGLAQSPVGSLLLYPGSWCAQDFVRALQKSVTPSPMEALYQIPLTFKVRFPGDSQFLGRIPGWEPDVGPRAFTTVWELLWYCFSSVFPPSRARFYCNCSPPVILLWPLLCPWMWAICFWWFHYLPADGCSTSSCSFGALQITS